MGRCTATNSSAEKRVYGDEQQKPMAAMNLSGGRKAGGKDQENI